MESACAAAAEKIQSEFNETHSKLDRVEKKVDQTWKDANQGQSTAEILRSFQEIKSDYQSVVEEVQRLQDSQKEALKNILDQLQRAHKTEEALKASLGDNKEQ